MKKKLLLLSCFIASFITICAQNFKGQWKGEFIDQSSAYGSFGGEQCEYVLELDISGKKVSGYSYTYFLNAGKRYFTICKLSGYIDKKKKYVEVVETERTKTNVPKNMDNCFQTHKLTYFKSGMEETLSGNWIPAPNQNSNCGFGSTSLTRRILATNFRNFENNNVAAKPKEKSNTTSPKIKNLNVPGNSLVKKDKAPKPVLKPRKDTIIREQAIAETPQVTKPQEKLNISPIKYEKRDNNVLKTIVVKRSTIQVDLYDNGEIDGDSISLFYNNKLLVSHKKLSAKPISLKINVDENNEENELMMYAENLGAIPPNTALMVVTDGPNRYEVRITSDLKRSGVIRFVLAKQD